MLSLVKLKNPREPAEANDTQVRRHFIIHNLIPPINAFCFTFISFSCSFFIEHYLEMFRPPRHQDEQRLQ